MPPPNRNPHRDSQAPAEFLVTLGTYERLSSFRLPISTATIRNFRYFPREGDTAMHSSPHASRSGYTHLTIMVH